MTDNCFVLGCFNADAVGWETCGIDVDTFEFSGAFRPSLERSNQAGMDRWSWEVSVSALRGDQRWRVVHRVWL